jgi:glycosyltransferase involved in cell wall biosynthesis
MIDMKIITVCSNEYPIPPPDNVIHASLYISALLAEGLAKRGHHITYVCAQGSTIKTHKVYPRTLPFFEIVKQKEWKNLGNDRLREQLIVPFGIDLYLTFLETIKKEKFDIAHFHPSPLLYALPFALNTGLPNVFTLHDVSSPMELTVIKTFNNENNFFISISNNQRKQFPVLKFFKTIYHGIPLQESYFDEKGGEAMVFTSRLKKIKGVEEAINVALKTKRRLKLSGDIRGSEKEYFYHTIKPLIDKSQGLVKFLHFVNRSMIPYFFAGGKLFIFPIQWEEPFGLVMIEAMACGTPVVVFARGSVPEVIKDGETGFIVNPSDDDIRGDFIIKKTGIEGLCEAVERIYSMPEDQYRKMRRACREHVEKNFTVERMVDEYEKVYEEIISQRK